VGSGRAEEDREKENGEEENAKKAAKKTCEEKGLTVRIEVTKEDIENGKRQDPYGCPVACALKRVTGIPVRVGVFTASIDDGTPYFHYVPLPAEVAKFITAFDTNSIDTAALIVPFSFEFEYPEKA
jgi:hypothetical protein